MKLFYGLQQATMLSHGVVATIGNFDGVHCGHQALLTSLREQARRLQLPMLVILFEPQPVEYFRGRKAPIRLMGLREKLEVLKAFQVDFVFCLKFNESLATMPAAVFAEQVIFRALHVKYLLLGSDFRFGRERVGDVNLLATLGEPYQAVVERFPDFLMEHGRVSSTDIRSALQRGCLEEAARGLGRPFGLCGRVITGDGRGRQLGVPTANIGIRRQLFPLSGVFSVIVRRSGNPEHQYIGVANLGRRPTIEDVDKLHLEVHILDFDEMIYGEMLYIEFHHKLRDEQRFSSLDQLINQIHRDIAMVRDMDLNNATVIEKEKA